MALVDLHPPIADLEAFALGSLDNDSLAAVETHIANCPTCQECAAAASGDSFVELLRRGDAQSVVGNDTVTEAAAQAPTPAPAPVQTESAGLPLAAPLRTDCTEPLDVLPAALARHERYRVLRLVGQGGMGCVYQAEHCVMQRTVALKVINRSYTANPDAVERFRREVRAAARLTHPNIVTAYDAETVGDTHFLVMEFVEGVTLARLVRERGPLPVAEACGYIRQAALGLQHAHERGMVHRDVKPGNLIRCSDGTVKALDFGLAMLTAERGDGLTDTNVIMGTPDYMAPEQAEDAHTADIRADVYSLGCTLYYLLTGRVPYPAGTPILKILAHREQPLPSLRQARPDVPPELAAIVARMMAKKPEDRYQTPGEVAAVLEPFAQARTQGDRKTTRKRWWLVAAVVLFFGLAAAGVAVYRIQTDKGELVIRTESPDVKVVISKGGQLVEVIDTKTHKQITLPLRSGDYELELKGAPEGLKLNINKATLTRGETVLAKIEQVEKLPKTLIQTEGGTTDNTTEIKHISEVVKLRTTALRQNTQNTHALLREVMNGKLAGQALQIKINDLNNDLTALWGQMASFGVGCDPYLDNIRFSNSGSGHATLPPDYGIPGPYVWFGLPRLHERFLEVSGVKGKAAEKKNAELQKLVQAYSNPAVYQHFDFDDRAYNEYRRGKNLFTPQYEADLKALDQWLMDLEAVLGKYPAYFDTVP